MDAARPLDTDVPCIQCSYNLRGLQPDGHCPECNAAIERSLCGDELRFADPEWLARVGRGLKLVIWAWYTMLVGCIVFIAFTTTIGAVMASLSGPAIGGIAASVVSTLFGLAATASIALAAIGIWLLTTWEPRAEHTGQPMRLRTWMRIASAIPAVAIVFPLILKGLSIASPIAESIAVLLAAIAVVVVVAGSSYYGRWLARRSPEPEVGEKLIFRGRRFVGLVVAAAAVTVVHSLAPKIGIPAGAAGFLSMAAGLLMLLVLVAAQQWAGVLSLLLAQVRFSLDTARGESISGNTENSDSIRR